MENYLENFCSLYEILLDNYQIQPVRAKSIFQATLPLLKDAEVLQLRENIPIMQIDSIMNHPSGTPIEYSVSRVRGDMHYCLIEF